MNKFIENAGIIPCGCGNIGHHILYVKDPDEPEIYVYVQLADQPWYKRLWKGIKYIFGYKCRFGMYDELIVNEDNIHFFLEWNEHIVLKTIEQKEDAPSEE